MKLHQTTRPLSIRKFIGRPQERSPNNVGAHYLDERIHADEDTNETILKNEIERGNSHWDSADDDDFAVGFDSGDTIHRARYWV